MPVSRTWMKCITNTVTMYSYLAAAAIAVKLPVRSRYGVEDGGGGLSSSGLVTAVDTWPRGQVRGMNQGCPEPAISMCGW